VRDHWKTNCSTEERWPMSRGKGRRAPVKVTYADGRVETRSASSFRKKPLKTRRRKQTAEVREAWRGIRMLESDLDERLGRDA
jgi:hypothetical protein